MKYVEISFKMKAILQPVILYCKLSSVYVVSCRGKFSDNYVQSKPPKVIIPIFYDSSLSLGLLVNYQIGTISLASVDYSQSCQVNLSFLHLPFRASESPGRYDSPPHKSSKHSSKHLRSMVKTIENDDGNAYSDDNASTQYEDSNYYHKRKPR